MPVARMMMAISLSFLMMINPLYAQGPRSNHGKKVDLGIHKNFEKVPEVKIKIKEDKCHSPCLVTAKLSLKGHGYEEHDKKKGKNKHKNNLEFIGYSINWNDGSPVEIITSNTVDHSYSFVIDRPVTQKKGKGHHFGVHKKKGEVKTFRPTVIALFKDGIKSKPDSDKVHVIAEYKNEEPQNQEPVAKLSVNPGSGIAPLSVTLDASSSTDDKGIVLYTFELGNGVIVSSTTPSYVGLYEQAGSFTAKVTVTDQEGLESSATSTVSVSAPPVNQAPVANLSASPLSGEAPLLVTFDSSLSSDDKGIVSRKFIFGDGQELTTTDAIVTHSYINAENFSASVSVFDAENLTSTQSIQIVVSAPPVNQAPVANLSANPLTGDAPLLVTFDSSLSNDDKGIVSRKYIFGDGQELITTEATVSHIYQIEGNYSAQVIAYDAENLSSTASLSITVSKKNTAPIASLSVDKNRANPNSSFRFDGSNSSDAENNIASFNLSNSVLGINLTNTSGIFDVVIAQSGSFEFILNVTDSFGLSNSARTTVSINAAPIANLVADKMSGVAPLTVTFDSSASSDDVSIVKRDYEFAPNVFALNAGNSVSYTYNTPGEYQAKVRIFDGENLVSEAVVTITVTAPQELTPPIAWFLIDIDPDSLEVRLRNKAEKGSSNLTSVRYELNGASIGESAIYDYSEVTFQGEFGSTYQIRQIVTDEQNQSDDQIFTIVLDPDTQKPIANFRIAQSNAFEVFVDATRSFDPFDQIANIQINWGDNSPVETLDSLFINHNYQIAGTYSVTLRVETESGLFATRTRQITVTDEATEALLPIANFNVEYEEHAKHVRLFSQYSGSPNGELLSFFWEYGDGQVGYGEQSVHFYSVGVYYARLTVTDSMNLRASQVQQIIITEDGPPIISSVSCDTFENFATCDFFAAHKDKQLDRVEINWGDSSPLQTIAATNSEWEIFSNINHQYQSAGTYTISIRAVTSTNLDYTHQTEVDITDSTGGNLPPFVALNCYAVEYTRIQCDTNGSFDPDGFIASTEITMGDGTIYNQSFVEHTYLSGGSYTITATVTDNLGARTTVSQTVNVLERVNQPPVAILNCSSNAINEVQCNAIGSRDDDGSISSIIYSFEDQTFVQAGNTFENIKKIFSNGGQKTIELTVTDNEGAVSKTQKIINVLENSPPFVAFTCSSINPLMISCNSSGTYDPENGPLQYSWDVEGIKFSGTSFEYTFKDLISSAQVSLSVTDSYSAVVILEKSISVLQPPIPSLQISCNVISNLKIGCSPQFYDPYRKITSYNWIVNNQVFSTESIEIQFEVSGEIIVTLEAGLSSGDNLNASQIVILQDTGIGIGPSDMNVTLQSIDESRFNPLLTELTFSLSGGEVLQDINNVPEYLRLEINGDFISNDILTITPEQIILSFTVQEGLNRVSLEFKDDEGHSFSKSWNFLAGSQTLNISGVDIDSNSVILDKVHVALREYPEFILIYNSQTISNVPNEEIIVYGEKNDLFGVESFLISPTSLNVEMVMVSSSSLVAHNNYSFETGLDYWTTFRGFADTSVHDNSTSIVQYAEGELDADFTPDSSGTLLTATKLSFDQETKGIEYPINLKTARNDSFFVSVVKNAMTGVVNFEVLVPEGEIDPTTGSIFSPMRISVGSEKNEDQILIFYAKIKDDAVASNKSILINEAFAATGVSGIEVNPYIDSIKRTATLRSVIDLRSQLIGLSLGSYPNFIDPRLPRSLISQSTNSFINPLKILLTGLTENEILNHNFIFELRKPNGQVVNSLPISVVNNELYVTIPSNWVFPDVDQYYVLLRMIPLDSVSRVSDVIAVGTFSNISSKLFYSIESLGDELINPSTYLSYRYFCNNCPIDANALEGYDHWIWSRYKNTIAKLRSYTYRYLDESGISQQAIVKTGDFSGINGKQLLAANKTRSGHVFGTDVDIRLPGTNANKAPYTFIEDNEQAANIVMALVNLFPNELRKYLVKMKIKPDDPPNQFESIINSSCSIDGRLMSDVVADTEGHRNHHHISFWEGRYNKKSPDFNPNLYQNNPLFTVSGNRVRPVINMGTMNKVITAFEQNRFQFVRLPISNLSQGDRIFYKHYKKEENPSQYKWLEIEEKSSNNVQDIFKSISSDGSDAGLFISTRAYWPYGRVIFKVLKKNGLDCLESTVIESPNIPNEEMTKLTMELPILIRHDNGYYVSGLKLSATNNFLDNTDPVTDYIREFFDSFDAAFYDIDNWYLTHGYHGKMYFNLNLKSQSGSDSFSFAFRRSDDLLNHLSSASIPEDYYKLTLETYSGLDAPRQSIDSPTTFQLKNCFRGDFKFWHEPDRTCYYCPNSYLVINNGAPSCADTKINFVLDISGDRTGPVHSYEQSTDVFNELITGFEWTINSPTGTILHEGPSYTFSSTGDENQWVYFDYTLKGITALGDSSTISRYNIKAMNYVPPSITEYTCSLTKSSTPGFASCDVTSLQFSHDPNLLRSGLGFTFSTGDGEMMSVTEGQVITIEARGSWTDPNTEQLIEIRKSCSCEAYKP